MEEIEKKYISKVLYESTYSELKEKQKEIITLNQNISQHTEKSRYLEVRVSEHKKEITELKNQMKLEFKNLSNQIFEDKSKKFLELNEKKVFDILNPLKERIQDFEKKVEDTYKEETRERASLKEHLKQITDLNQKLSQDTEDLTKALKGDKKLQGNWGEVQLEQILKYAGLEKEIHYYAQKSFETEEGQRALPDFVVNLPEDKNLVIDSKVSLVAYEKYFNEEDEEKKKVYLRTHIANMKTHMLGLASKNYQALYGINAPDYVMMFVPIEPALYTVLKAQPSFWQSTLENNIVPVSTSTLLATLRTISFIWKQENQKNNVIKIAKESGKLYDKLSDFIEDLIRLGKKLDGVKIDHTKAMNKLYTSTKKGETIIGRIERLKKLGANTTKSLPQSLPNRIDE
ncbi:DNA recombination protein RmuC [Elysia marginata]|uniref:DNA recombination protein RmuC n=1 Tax=Elysia marginata TaxID=1093978 RepID=A0AAV4GZI2_9GAST|nr:DNA recombination protein RmuC [Elysia marginata]